MDILNLLYKVDLTQLNAAQDKVGQLGKTTKAAEGEAGRLSSALGKVGEAGGLVGDAVSHVQNLTANVRAAVSAASALPVALLAAVGAAGILASIRFAGQLDDLGDMAEKFGLSATQASLLSQQLEAGGSSINAYYGSLQRVTSALAKAGDEGKAAAAALKTLGVNVKEGATPLETAQQLAEKYGQKLREGSVSVDEMAALQLVLGRNYRESIIAVEQAAIAQERLNSFQAAGVGISSDGTKAAGDYERAQNDLNFVLQSVGSLLVAKIVPAFTALISQLVDSYKNGGLVRVAFEGIQVAANMVMVPIRVLINLFITLDTVVTSVGKAIGAVFAALATRSLEPLKALKEDVAQLFAEADKKVQAVGFWGTDSGTVEPSKTLTVTPSAPGNDKADKKKEAEALRELKRLQDEASKRALNDIKRYEEAEAAAEREYQQLLKRIGAYKDLADPAAKYRRELQQLISDYETGLVPAEAFAAKQLEIEENIKKAGEAAKKTEDDFKFLERVGQTAFKGLEDSLVNLVMTGKFSFKDLVTSMIGDIMRLFVQMVVIAPMMKALRQMMGLDTTASANGNVFGKTGLVQSADGNVFDGPVLHGFKGGVGMLGEAGPEAVMPLRRGADGKLGVVAAGSSGTTVINNVQVNVEGGRDAKETGDLVSARVLQAMRDVADGRIANARRPGGVLSTA